MKLIKITLLAAVLATSLTLSNMSFAEAATATVEDGNKQISPKSFGDKNKYKTCDTKLCFDEKFSSEKSSKLTKEKQKMMKKYNEYVKARTLLNQLYGL